MVRRSGSLPKNKSNQQTGNRIKYSRKSNNNDPNRPKSNHQENHASPKTQPKRGSAVSQTVPVADTLLGLTPLAPLIVRSGRPFDDQAGADPARLPPPSTVAGCLRTALGRQQGEHFRRRISADQEEQLNALGIQGPLLLRENLDGNAHILVPRPADALYSRDQKTKNIHLLRAAPKAPDADEHVGSDLPTGLLPVSFLEEVSGKPAPGPAWWTLEHLLEFRKPGVLKLDYASVQKAGWSPPSDDLRTHVAIDRERQASKSGQLFQTRGFDLEPTWTWRRRPKEDQPPPALSMRLLVRTSEPLLEDLVHLGGERRLASLAPEPAEHWPKPQQELGEEIADAGGLSLTLLTPALFDQGWRPGWLDKRLSQPPPGLNGCNLHLRAAALDRWQSQSGWDLARQQPRAARRMVPAGAVYWFSLKNAARAKDLNLWLQSICDREQDRRDGFGLVLPCPWTPPTASK
ncbi:MAG TPA: CRISPR-associated protein Cmr3 [Chromatiaceae bacterium]|jgi:CRISPR-associated protein Cmr3|nr:MAG: hypothetical protein N838_04800 [Thiohalocapsa sp. PB-PSB1]QQO56045.1 MAG: CRISPR-associated protein Cmr3 [Thiohalocapsa sp. PB-PSB1]HBG95849.1 CRISPR-associated protein Cmr3 [Chromatiaceae bacterium]HCS91944.1 CRISPR-associated protein Cmr3 [Chromatiaceae bacterium]